MKKILIIKAGSTYPQIRSKMGDFEDWIIDQAEIPRTEVRVCSVYEKEPLPEAEEISAAIITGSHSNVTEKADWMKTLEDWLREKAGGRVPLLGICFGHQIMAEAFGGKVDFHAGGIELGTNFVRLTEEGKKDPLFRGLPGQFPVLAAHSQTVLKLPPGARLLAVNDFEPHHAFYLGNRTWGLQFHPEFKSEVLKMYIRQRQNPIKAEVLNEEVRSEDAEADLYGKLILKRFVEIIRG